jgi:peptidyl-prolyl cis-trans isomerase B (cyclophilin B)
MLTALLISAGSLAGNPTVTWEAPGRYVEGATYPVSLEITAPDDGAPVASWLLTPSAFSIDGKPVTERKGKEIIALAPGATLSLSFDLAPAIRASGAVKSEGFELGFAKEYLDSEPIAVAVATAAPQGLNFMEMPVGDLSKYQVIMSTNRGDMVLEFWPDAAPGHVRNYLDLCYTGFYDGLTFHRVIPGFMIQGGCPDGTGSGNGPRQLEAEFSKDPKYKHVPGVLSMARTADPNSASCQFFLMHKNSPHLDGQYSAFGICTDGLEILEQIVSTPRGRNDRPNTKQYIKSATVILAE